MAEARSAVHLIPSLYHLSDIDPSSQRLQASVTEDGLALFIPNPKLYIKALPRLGFNLWYATQQAFMPVPVWSVFAVILSTTYMTVYAEASSWLRSGSLSHFLWDLDSMLPFVHSLNITTRVAYLAFITALVVCLVFTLSHRLFLRLLLSYTGWMDEQRGKKSLKTIVWGALLKFIYIRNSKTHTQYFQGALPSLPLPSLRDTANRYFETMEPLLTPKDAETLKSKMNHFLKHEGPKLQSKLWLKRMFSSNYIKDWWLDLVYLRGRESIMINSNFFGIQNFDPIADPNPTQVARAAMAIHRFAVDAVAIEDQRGPPTMIQGLVPLCMAQYNSLYGLTRVPHLEKDQLVKHDLRTTRHVIVTHRGRYYKVNAFRPHSRIPYSARQLERALQKIADTEGRASDAEQRLASLTAANRSKWAEIREQFFRRDPLNRCSLEAIEKSLLVVHMDDADTSDGSLLDIGHSLMHGTGGNRWLDKSFCVVVTANARVGINGEHSWGDAPVIAHALEKLMAYERKYKPYENGHVKEDGQGGVPTTERLAFHFPDALTKEIGVCYDEARAMVDDFELDCVHFKEFGKGLIKKAKVSPDAFIQMALQLAFFRDQNKFVQTYESAMARLYVHGRTETIRTVSHQSCAFVRAMEDPNATNAERLQLLQKAGERHSQYTTRAMTGRGVDRHLFALYVCSLGLKIDSPFLQEVMGVGWKLSTSQIPQRQCSPKEHLDGDMGDKYPLPCGGFGPVADDGYGACYTIAGDIQLYFFVSAKKSCPSTSSKRLIGHIQQALRDMRKTFDA